jgi:hypothetical protein
MGYFSSSQQDTPEWIGENPARVQGVPLPEFSFQRGNTVMPKLHFRPGRFSVLSLQAGYYRRSSE